MCFRFFHVLRDIFTPIISHHSLASRREKDKMIAPARQRNTIFIKSFLPSRIHAEEQRLLSLSLFPFSPLPTQSPVNPYFESTTPRAKLHLAIDPFSPDLYLIHFCLYTFIFIDILNLTALVSDL